ncbi:ORF6N domain-containing protein [Clostridium cochlearium]|uniref:Phage anti-repressor n=1 Tax=Clostridium cochlearium TaxID=1494 RepID=A0A2X2VXR3_CLOCO|nr:ORF6N domain-containing protein [Clostridium cochlearium]SQB33966.1 phage anti-repressor [Clostridium cochlearium]
MSNLIPVEFKKQRVITTELLAQVYETDVNNIQANFKRNEKHFKEGKHYFKLEGEVLKEFKNRPTISQLVSKHASQLYLWTERGANRHCKILDTDKAWDQFDNLEETYFRVKENKPTCIEDVLIQSLQEMKDVKQQLNQVNHKVLETKEELKTVREVIEIRPSNSWRGETNRLMTKICFKLKDYKKPKEEAYKALEERAGCDLKIRLKNMKARQALQGVSKSKIDELNYLDVIAQDKKLIEIYTTIVGQMAIRNGIGTN